MIGEVKPWATRGAGAGTGQTRAWPKGAWCLHEGRGNIRDLPGGRGLGGSMRVEHLMKGRDQGGTSR